MRGLCSVELIDGPVPPKRPYWTGPTYVVLSGSLRAASGVLTEVNSWQVILTNGAASNKWVIMIYLVESYLISV